jgi:hypothetical protein
VKLRRFFVWREECLKPWIKVRVKFLSFENGGRETPVFICGSYRPHIRIIGDTEYLGVQFIEDIGETTPNEEIETKVCLIYYPRVSYEKISEGVKIEIFEGAQIVGKGEIVSPVIIEQSSEV